MNQESIEEFNLKVIRREPSLQNVQRILKTVKHVHKAKYNVQGQHWNYLKVKGPMFLVEDKFGQLRMVILNQLSADNDVLTLQQHFKYELTQLPQGCMLNYIVEDSINGSLIYGIWSLDPALKEIYQQLQKHRK